MSHTSVIEGMNIGDVAAMRVAVQKLQEEGINCQLLEKAKPRMYYPRQEEFCDFVLKLTDGAYDVGFRRNDQGTYDPVFDTYRNHVRGQIGATCPMPNTSEGRTQHAIGKFAHHYNKEVAMKAAVMAGHTVESVHVDESGNAQIVVKV